jgi:hypothetical protein
MHCATLCGGGYWPQIYRFGLRDYVYSHQRTLTIWMWLWGMLFFMFRQLYLLKSYCWRVKMVKYGRTMCIICAMSPSQCGWPNWFIFNSGSYWLMNYVMWAIFRNYRCVDLWLMFSRLAYGVSYATLGRNANWKMVLLLVHQIHLGF